MSRKARARPILSGSALPPLLESAPANSDIRDMAFVFDHAHKGRKVKLALSPAALEVIRSLQVEQLAHDHGYHKDILALPVDRRMTHMSLHMCKYVGQVLEALREEDDTRLALTLTDALIISFASANALEIDLSSALAAEVVVPDSRGKPLSVSRTQERDWFSYRFAAVASRLAKACESQDHKEKFPIKETMVQCTIAFLLLLWIETIHRHLDPSDLVRTRWRQVEAKIDRVRQVIADRT